MLCTTTELEAPLLTLEGFQKEMAPSSLHTVSEPNGVKVASQLRTCLPVGGNVALPAYFDRSVTGIRAFRIRPGARLRFSDSSSRPRTFDASTTMMRRCIAEICPYSLVR